MNRSVSYYKRLSFLALVVFLLLAIVQLYWLRQAVRVQQQATKLQLQQLIPDIALNINSMGHHFFHGEDPPLANLDFTKVEQNIQHYLDSAGVTSTTYFSIYQAAENGFFYSNAPHQYQDQLKHSTIRSCMSCIVSFSIGKSLDPLPGEDDAAYAKRMNESTTFQYYSPINGLKKEEQNIIWLAFYQPHSFSYAIRSLFFLFDISVLLLLVLLALFYYLLRQLSKHKKLAQIKEDFFNNVTHEFKTPLSSIRLASRVLRQNKALEKNESYYDLIEKETKVLENQIDKLLQLSLLDNRELELEFTPVDLHQIIHDIPTRMKPLLEEYQGMLSMDLQLQNCIIQGDPNHLSNSLCNLIENSLKYAEKEVNIWISSYGNAEEKVIVIRDDGPGIRAEFQKHIFDRFYRAQKQNQYKNKGFGIGLSYVKTIIEAHQGQVHFNPKYTSGSEFIIKFSS